MKEIEIEKLRQLVSRTDMSGNQKVDWLVNFINEREQSLRIHDVVGSVFLVYNQNGHVIAVCSNYDKAEEIFRSESGEFNPEVGIDVVGRSEQCCSPTDGFYLGTTCPHCKKPFRKDIK